MQLCFVNDKGTVDKTQKLEKHIITESEQQEQELLCVQEEIYLECEEHLNIDIIANKCEGSTQRYRRG